MADSSSNIPLPSLKQISSSIFHTSGSWVAVGAKGLPDFDSVWSPTSPLDCRLFSNRGSAFSVKSSRPSFRTGHKQQLDCSKVGLGIVSSLVNETKLNNEILGKFQRKNIIFGPQVKSGILKFSKNNHESLAPYLKSNSLPKNYIISLPSETKSPKSEVESFDDVNWESEGVKTTMTSLPDSSRTSSLINSTQNSNLEINDLFVENTSTVMSFPPVISRGSPVDNSLSIKSSSLPISIDFSKGYIGSLSAREIELSEDYTCIISHGPNPKRTHIFGDYILECSNNDFTEFIKKEGPAFRSSQIPTFSEGSANHPFDNVLSFCYSCNKKLEQEEDICLSRGEKALCCCNCRSEKILAEEEMEKTCTNSVESSPDSSYHDLFLKSLFESE